MMYFPLLRGKRFELQAVRDLTDKLLGFGTIIPVIEPVKRGGLSNSLEKLVDSTARFAFIVNPKVGEFSENRRLLDEDIINEYLDEYDNYYPTQYVNAETSVRAISDFSSRFELEPIYVVEGNASDAVIQSIIASQPAYVIVSRGRVPTSAVKKFHEAEIELVALTDHFNRKVRNADYPLSELFSDIHSTIDSDEHFSHFADYSIVGEPYTEGGGAAFNVALHHIVAEGSDHEHLFIKHYKSNYSDNTSDVAGKFLEALNALIADQSGCSSVNKTSALTTYKKLASDKHFPGLGFAKKLGIMQHLEVVGNVLAL